MVRNAPKRLREFMKTEPLVWAPGVYDGYSARIANAVGFPALPCGVMRRICSGVNIGNA
jgi:2-methylisocitrate lyase-like PEP mutase family enzyme